MRLKKIALALAPVWLVSSLYAQEVTVTGRLFDPNGEPIAGLQEVSAQLTNVETQQGFEGLVSSLTGEFSITGVPPGIYDMTIPIPCCLYGRYEKEGISIEPEQTLQLDVAIEWGMNLGTIADDPGTLGADMRARAGRLSGPAPRMPDGKPDLSGVWSWLARPGSREGPPPRPVLKPWAAEIDQQLRELNVDRNAGAYCLPQSAIPTTIAYPTKFVQTPSVIVQLTEWSTPGVRQIFLDGREFPEYWNPSWLGHSTGTWEGDTLVVETIGFNEITPMLGVHSEQLRVVERFSRPDYGRLEVEIMAEDPEAWEEPMRMTMQAQLVPDEEILEWVCENLKEPVHDLLPWRGRP
jgi:hypothetical protein